MCEWCERDAATCGCVDLWYVDAGDDFVESLLEQDDRMNQDDAAAQEAYDRSVYEGGEW